MHEPLIIEGCPFPATACIGIAIFPDDAADAEGLRKAADQAMYRAKGRGRNQYEVFSADARDALDIQKHLRKAIDEGGFEVVYQPQFFKDRSIACVEALLRFRHPTLGMIPPSRFIPISEESRLIVPIGDWVLREVCRQNVAWRRETDVPITVAINVSALQFNRIDFADSVAKILDETGADPSGRPHRCGRLWDRVLFAELLTGSSHLRPGESGRVSIHFGRMKRAAQPWLTELALQCLRRRKL